MYKSFLLLKMPSHKNLQILCFKKCLSHWITFAIFLTIMKWVNVFLQVACLLVKIPFHMIHICDPFYYCELNLCVFLSIVLKVLFHMSHICSLFSSFWCSNIKDLFQSMKKEYQSFNLSPIIFFSKIWLYLKLNYTRKNLFYYHCCLSN